MQKTAGVYVTENTRLWPDIFPGSSAPAPLPPPSRGTTPSGRPAPKRLRAAQRHACSRSESWLLGLRPTSACSGFITRLRSYERLVGWPARCSCRSRSPTHAQKTRQFQRGERKSAGSGAPLACMCVLACRSMRELPEFPVNQTL